MFYYGSNYYGSWYYNSWYYGGGGAPPSTPGSETLVSTSGSRGGYFVPEEFVGTRRRPIDSDEEEWAVLQGGMP